MMKRVMHYLPASGQEQQELERQIVEMQSGEANSQPVVTPPRKPAPKAEASGKKTTPPSKIVNGEDLSEAMYQLLYK